MFPHAVEPPYLTTEQMREVDRVMIEHYGIDLAQMMENAGRALAHLARIRFLGGDPRGKHVVVLAGSGGNGGGTLVCARRLHNFGAHVRVFTAKDGEAFASIPRRQLGILQRMDVPIHRGFAMNGAVPADVIIDGLIGYSLQGAPRGPAADFIRWANAQPAPILALDTPSGLDTTTGVINDPAVQATATLTLALPKEGLRAPGASASVGELYLADISVPPALYARPPLNLNVGPLFAESDILRLT